GEPAVAALTGDEVWKQFQWLRDMDGFGLAAFLANRIEVRLRAALSLAGASGTGLGASPNSISFTASRARTMRTVMGRKGGASGGQGALEADGASELLEAKESLRCYLAPLGGYETQQALLASASQSVTRLLRERRDTVEMAMYKSGFLGGRPQGGVPPRKR
ncbi:unnamed protein product, partial [Ectocarpus sp. 12 AP-2014]